MGFVQLDLYDLVDGVETVKWHPISQAIGDLELGLTVRGFSTGPRPDNFGTVEAELAAKDLPKEKYADVHHREVKVADVNFLGDVLLGTAANTLPGDNRFRHDRKY